MLDDSDTETHSFLTAVGTIQQSENDEFTTPKKETFKFSLLNEITHPNPPMDIIDADDDGICFISPLAAQSVDESINPLNQHGKEIDAIENLPNSNSISK